METLTETMKEDHTGKTNRGDQIMRVIVGITLATSLLVVPLTLGKPVGASPLISLEGFPFWYTGSTTLRDA